MLLLSKRLDSSVWWTGSHCCGLFVQTRGGFQASALETLQWCGPGRFGRPEENERNEGRQLLSTVPAHEYRPRHARGRLDTHTHTTGRQKVHTNLNVHHSCCLKPFKSWWEGRPSSFEGHDKSPKQITDQSCWGQICYSWLFCWDIDILDDFR